MTGATGMVGGPLAKRLAADGNTVFGGARFTNAAARDDLFGALGDGWRQLSSPGRTGRHTPDVTATSGDCPANCE